MRLERLGEKAVILRNLPCPAFELARVLNVLPDPFADAGSPGTHHSVTADTELHRGEFGTRALVFEEAVASYDAVGLYFSEAVENLDGLLVTVSSLIENPNSSTSPESKVIEIPVCYELGPDLKASAQALQMPTEELIKLHLQIEYRCYAVGFSPGFAYLGYLNDRISTLPRLGSPRPRVEPGSVGITGRQTAVYPSATPGGWNLIGKCPLVLVDVEANYFPIESGDQVRFLRIDEREFERRLGERL